MTDILCGYANRDETIVSYLYDDIDPAARRVFQEHLLTCSICRDELAAFRTVQKRLAQWEPPTVISRQSSVVSQQSSVVSRSRQSWWREIPVWAQVAAALLFVGVAAGVANLDVRYDQSGLSVRTGWSSNRAGAAGAAGRAGEAAASSVAQPASRDARVGGLGGPQDAPWRADLARLEQQLRSEVRSASAGTQSTGAAVVRNVSVGTAADAETLKRVRALLDESEKRQQRELALRVAEVLRDVNAQRQADLVKIDRSLGQMNNDLGVQVLQQRQSLNYLMRVNQRQ